MLNDNIPIDPALSDHPYTFDQEKNEIPSLSQYGTEASLPIVAGVPLTPGRHHISIPAPSVCQNVTPDYGRYKLEDLKRLCKTRNLKVGGRKLELVGRLEADDKSRQGQMSSSVLHSSNGGVEPVPQVQAPISTSASDIPGPQDPDHINSAQVFEDSASLATCFMNGLENDGNGDIIEEDDDEDESIQVEQTYVDTLQVRESLEFADKFILETRRKGGRQTETSVLKQWKAWAGEALNSKVIPDIVIDANHIIEYLKYVATRQLFNTRGKKLASGRLSASSLKKIMTMLGRVRRCQEEENPGIRVSRPAKTSRTDDFYKAVMIQSQRLCLESENFDITKGTILDSQLRPSQLDEVTDSIFLNLSQLPSIIKAHFSWTWQCSTLNRSDEVVSLHMKCIQPLSISIPNWSDDRGRFLPSKREEFGILALFHETKTAQPGKTEPAYSFVLPHKDPLKCPVGTLAILLHYMFDQEDLVSSIPDWEWGNQASWFPVHVLFGKTVGQPITGDALGRMYSKFLNHTTITSSKKTHLARCSLPTILEDMGVPADQVDATGHWKGNTRREIYGSKIPKVATVALAGFPVGESYIVPWAKVPVPDSLQQQIFPFYEDVQARLQSEGCQNQGIINFIELLGRLRPFFWRTIGAINARFPNSPIIKRLNVLSSSEASKFLSDWPKLRHDEDLARLESVVVENTFQETSTRNAFSVVTSKLQDIAQQMESTSAQVSSIHRRTDQFSPSKESKTCCGCGRGNTGSEAEITHTRQLEHMPPLRISQPSRPSTPSPLVPLHLSSRSSSPHSSPTYHVSTPSLSSSATIYPSIHSPSISISQSSSPSSPSIKVLVPQRMVYQDIIYYILPLSLPSAVNQPPPRTQHHLILPPAIAFMSSMYPTFTTRDCTWQFVFDKVTNPSALWLSYAPESLGDYQDLKSLWQAWDEGTYLADVGRKPPLRLIDAKWGNLKSLKTGKKRYPSWRPRNDDKARKVWSNFYFFIHQIEERMKAGHSSDDAVSHFEVLRGNRSLSQLHRSLQEKKRKQGNTNGE